MKTVLVFFADSDCGSWEDYGSAVNALLRAGYKADSVAVIADDETELGKLLENTKRDGADVVIFGRENLCADIKAAAAKACGTSLIENETARKFAEAVATAKGAAYEPFFAAMPENARHIPNIDGCVQGFVCETDGASVFVLSGNPTQWRAACEKYVAPYLDEKYSLKRKRLVLKYFGDRALLDKTLKEAESVSDSRFTADVTVKNGDCTVALCFDDYEKTGGAAAVRYIVSSLKDDIYAEYDVSPAERLFDLLKLKKLKIAVAESFTGGRVVSSLIKNPGASATVVEGLVTYSDESKKRILGVNPADLKKEGAVSAAVAYQMAAGIINGSGSDVAIATTGLAGPDTDASGKPVGLCYIAVGNKNGVHTYRFNIKGDRETVTETAKNAALCLAIKNVKNHNI